MIRSRGVAFLAALALLNLSFMTMAQIQPTPTQAPVTITIDTNPQPPARTVTRTVKAFSKIPLHTFSRIPGAAAVSPAPGAPLALGAGSPTDTTSRPTPVAAAGAAAAAAAAQADSEGGLEERVVRDPALGAFPGQDPVVNIDLPLTIIFLLLFAGGAVTHISIYRANAKRGHKFLLSDLVFDFCMVRVVTCIFRIIWVFVKARGVVLAALIFQNAGAVVLFAVNIFFVQRLVRSMQPKYGWHPLFGYATLGLAFSVPAIIIFNIVSLSVSFFSIGNERQLAAAEGALRFGQSWNLLLVIFPIVALFFASMHPGPEPEPFGKGPLRLKAAVLLYAATTLSVGAALRLAAIVNPQAPDTQSVLFSKALFYTTGFLLEILVVALYAFIRVDLLFHIPDGSSGPGDYSRTEDEPPIIGVADIEKKLLQLGVPFQVLGPPGGMEDTGRLVVAFSTDLALVPGGSDATPPYDMAGEKPLPRRPSRVSRRQSLSDALRPPRPRREYRSTLYITSDKGEGSDSQTLQPRVYLEDEQWTLREPER